MKFKSIMLTIVLLLVINALATALSQIETDIVVYGATSSGITAAIAATPEKS